MVTSTQAKKAAERLKDPSYQRALANRSKSGITTTAGMGIDSTIIPTVDDALKLSVQSSTNIQKTILKQGETQMTQAGLSVNDIYTSADQLLFSGLLPGGSEVDTDKLKVAATGAAVGAGLVGVGALAYAGYKYLTKDGKQRKLKKDGTPYKQPRMNYANPKALGRAERRMKSYIKHARKHVSAMGFTIKRRGTD